MILDPDNLTEEQAKDLAKRRSIAKKLTKSLIDMENVKFSTTRQLKAVNEVLAIVNKEHNKRVFARATTLFNKLSNLG